MIHRPDLPLGYATDKQGNVTSYKGLDGHWREYKRDEAGNVVEFRSSFGEYAVYSLRAPKKKDTLGIEVAAWCFATFLVVVTVCSLMFLLWGAP